MYDDESCFWMSNSVDITAESQAFNEAKLMLVGDGGVGKTSLANCLLGRDAFSSTQEFTAGIEISHWSKVVAGQTSYLNFWDFGGQEILYSIHQLFLSPRGIYVLVLDARSGAWNAERWLELTLACGKGAPVLVVVNKADQRKCALDERTLRTRYPNIVGFHRVSCLSGEGIVALTDAIWDAARSLPHFSMQLPLPWLRVRRALSATARDYIDQDEFIDLCAEQGIENQQQQLTLLRYLHDLGLVMYFPGIALQLLNPTWVTSAIYRILQSAEARSTGGVLDFARLKRVLGRGAKPHYQANERRAIVEIMKAADLCYDEVPNERVLIPSLLPELEPDFVFDCRTSATIRCECGVFPAAVFFKLIVRLHNDAVFEQRWRTGAVFRGRNLDCRVLLRSDRSQSAIQVWLDGSDRWQAWELICTHILAITNSLDRIELRVVVPCGCDHCLDQRRPHMYLLRSLLTRAAQGQRFVTCENSDATVSLAELLPLHPGLATPLINNVPTSPMVFLSYSSKDSKTITNIAADMRALGIPYWFDAERIKPGDSVSKALDEALDVCRILVACLSEHQLTSGWARAEYASALAGFLSAGGKRVIPLFIDGLARDEVPPLLRDLHAVRLVDADDYRKFLNALKCDCLQERVSTHASNIR